MPARAPLPEVTAVILAGGEGRRMGGRDKGWVEVDGRALIEHVLAHVTPQVGAVLISANRELGRYAALGFPVLRDQSIGFEGPLAGISVAIAYARTPWLLTVPVDARDVAPDLAERLSHAAREHGALAAVAHDGERDQPLFALYAQELAPRVKRIFDDGERRVRALLRQVDAIEVSFADRADSFSNLNALGDTARPG